MNSSSLPFTIETLKLGPMDNFVYLISDNASKRTAVVDPAWEVPQIVALAQHQHLQITDVLLTHSHYDHVNGLNELLRTYDAQVHLLKAEAQFWEHYQDIPTLHYGGDTIQLGKTAINIWHTPGHTPGSACYCVDGHLITGDTLFIFGCGRCDLTGGNPEQMYQTLKKLAAELPAQTLIYPGHDYAEIPTSTMAEQLVGNPFMHFDKCVDFVNYRLHQHDRIRQPPLLPVYKENSQDLKKN